MEDRDLHRTQLPVYFLIKIRCPFRFHSANPHRCNPRLSTHMGLTKTQAIWVLISTSWYPEMRREKPLTYGARQGSPRWLVPMLLLFATLVSMTWAGIAAWSPMGLLGSCCVTAFRYRPVERQTGIESLCRAVPCIREEETGFPLCKDRRPEPGSVENRKVFLNPEGYVPCIQFLPRDEGNLFPTKTP